MILRRIRNFVLRSVRRLIIETLDHEDIHRKVWLLANRIPPDRDLTDHILTKVGNIEKTKYRIATEQTARFVLEHLPDARAFNTPEELLAHAVGLAREVEGLFMEFGVFCGSTINLISGQVPDRPVHGFDSFEGLPENWRDCPEGAFSTHGVLPKVNPNVKLHVGLFNDTLPGFIKAQNAFSIAFLHVDCDLYSSAKTIFDCLGAHIKPGTVIVFDEFFNYPNFQDHEFKAWFEFQERSGHACEYIGYSNQLTALALRIK